MNDRRDLGERTYWEVWRRYPLPGGLLPAGVYWRFLGNYTDRVRASARVEHLGETACLVEVRTTRTRL